jgi:hypothetical protein
MPKTENKPLQSRMRDHLIPDSHDKVLRYAETQVRSDGSFELGNLAPGKYRIVVRPVPDDEFYNRPALPTAWDAAERSKLRKDAEAGKIEIELKPCSRSSDLVIRF